MISQTISTTASTFKRNTKLCLVAGFTAALVTLAPQPLPVRADLASSIESVNTAMGMLSNVADVGVGIALTPFGIGFALTIAKHVLRAGT